MALYTDKKQGFVFIGVAEVSDETLRYYVS